MLFKQVRFGLVLVVILSLLSLNLACKKSSDDDEEDDGPGTPVAKGVPYKSTGNEGTITGKVNLTGTPPAPQTIDMSQDANCKIKNPNPLAETLVANNGTLQYAFVYIKEGTITEGNKKIDSFSFGESEQPVLDQLGCAYKPRVLGIQVSQKLTITNSDPTGHNIHALPKSGSGNEEWNESQPNGAAPIVRSFKRSEILVPVKCNQHPWMKAYIGVLKHPFFGVSQGDGTFTIKNVPPGTYTLVAWHEKLGEKTMQVKVDAKGAATADFTFDAAAASAEVHGGSLELMPAMELPMLGVH